MSEPNIQQMITACEQARYHLRPAATGRQSGSVCQTDEGPHEGPHIEVFASPQLVPKMFPVGDWYKVGLLFRGESPTGLGVYLNARNGRIRTEQPQPDAHPLRAPVDWRDEARADDDGWNPGS